MKKLVVFAAVVLAVHVSVSTSQQANLECYSCWYEIYRDKDVENCINPGPLTPTQTCAKGEICWAEFGWLWVFRACQVYPSSVSINREQYAGSAYFGNGTSCVSSRCNDKPFTVPKFGKQVTCYQYSKSVPNPVNSLDELCAKEEGGKCKMKTCYGSCRTSVSKNATFTDIDLHCEPRQCDATYARCCESDLCNNNITVTQKIDRKPVQCYTCNNFNEPKCRQTCTIGSCLLEMTIEANGSVTTNTRGCNTAVQEPDYDYYDYEYYNSSSSKYITIYKNTPTDIKWIQKFCYTDLCNSDVDIPETYQSLLDEYNGGKSGSAPTSGRASAGTTVLLLLCTIATVLMEGTRTLSSMG